MGARLGRKWAPRTASYALAGVAALLAGAFVSSMNLVVLGTAALLLIAADGLVLARRAPRLEFSLSSRRLREGSAVEVSVRSRSAARRNQQALVELDEGWTLEEGSNLFSLAGDRHTFRATARVRGPRRIGPVRVRRWSPLRLWSDEEDAVPATEVEVVPRVEDVSSVGLTSSVLKPLAGRFVVNRPGQGFDFFALRQYQPGDTIRDVNWKASARSEDLVVNQRQRETLSELTLLVDAGVTQGVGPVGRTPLDRSCRAALGIYSEAINSRDIVHVVAYGAGVSQPDVTLGGKLHAVETFLANLRPARGTPLREAWQRVRPDVRSAGPVVVLTSGEGDNTLWDTVRQIRARGHTVTVLSPCPTGPAWAADASTERRRARARAMDLTRASGAVVADWAADQPPGSPRPEPVGRWVA